MTEVPVTRSYSTCCDDGHLTGVGKHGIQEDNPESALKKTRVDVLTAGQTRTKFRQQDISSCPFSKHTRVDRCHVIREQIAF